MDESGTRDSIYAEFDVGNLCAYNVVSLHDEKRVDDSWLQKIASAGAQSLINKLWELPVENHGATTVIKLPEPSIPIPREKHLPKKRPLTKWEQFKKEKNLKTQKKEKLVWDETAKEWKPRYGYRSVKNTDQSDWVIELPDNSDPNENTFAKKKEKKHEAVAKNEYQRLRNIASTTKQSDPNRNRFPKKKEKKHQSIARNEHQQLHNIAVATKQNVTSMESVEKAGKEELLKRLSAAKTSTASLGKFTKKLSKEKAPKNSGKKRKFSENIPKQMTSERDSNLKIFAELAKKKPKLEVQEAVQLHMKNKQSKPQGEKKSEKSGKKKPHNNKKQQKSRGKKRLGGKRNRGPKNKK